MSELPEWDEWAEELSKQASLAARAARSGFALYLTDDCGGCGHIVAPGDRWLLDDIAWGTGYETFASFDEVEEHLAADEKLNGRTTDEEDDEEDRR